MPSIFQLINQRADAIKAAKWAAYQPLTRQQLSDKLDDADLYVTIVSDPALTSGSDRRSTTVQSGAKWLSHFVVLKRPTEVRAILHAQGKLTFESDDNPLNIPRPAELRWCIFCRERHPLSAFIYRKHYPHQLSFACKRSIQERKRATWHFDGAGIDSLRILTIEKTVRNA